jgi:coenzyme F420-reducing hydrogenase alpha subunit
MGTSHHVTTTSGGQAQPLSLDEKYKKLKKAFQRVTPSATRENQWFEEWFDEVGAKVNEEKNATRERAIQIKTRGAKNDKAA